MAGDSDQWLASFVEETNDDDAFATATEQFDGSVALQLGSRTVWLKIYRGSIIDTEPYVPMTGMTFEVVGEPDEWARLVRGEASLSEQLYRGAIATRGNKIEANRMREATELLVRHLRAFDWEAIR